MNKLKLLALILAATVSVPASSTGAIDWHMVNVNYDVQGDAHLIIDTGINTLIDTGQPIPAQRVLVPYLQNLGITTIHHLFVSHPHTDHYGGIDPLLDAGIEIKNIYYNLPPEGVEDWNYKRDQFLATTGRAQKKGTLVSDIGKGFMLNLPSSVFTVLYAHKDSKFDGSAITINDYSMIMRWDARGYRTLFTGDLDATIGAELAKLKHFKADVLKVPHHGVESVAPDAFFDVVAPRLNMFPSTWALWIHPRIKQVKSWTNKAGIYFCNNGLNGSVVLTFTGRGITVRSEKQTHDCPTGPLDLVAGPKINESGKPPIAAVIGWLTD